jgi:hypothetical protein
VEDLVSHVGSICSLLQSLGLSTDGYRDAPHLSLRFILGVFYHLHDPLAALREVATLATSAQVIETHIEQAFDPRPVMIFYPRDELNGDPTAWRGPNAACMIELVRQQGFCRIEVTSDGPCCQIFHASARMVGMRTVTAACTGRYCRCARAGAARTAASAVGEAQLPTSL